jgi:hypothetical protein
MKYIILFCLVLLLAACSATPTSRNFKEGWRDNATTTDIRWKFGRDDLVKAGNIHIETWRGVVTLTGRATSEAEKARAEELARQVKNVTDVRNYLDVVDSGQAPAVEQKPTVASTPTAVPNLASQPKPTEKPVLQEEVIVEKTAKNKKVNGVEYQIGKELANVDEDAISSKKAPAVDDDITRQAEEELKELQKKKGK